MAPRTAWSKGQSGNPRGRPKKEKALTDLLAKYLNGKDDEDGGLARKHVLVRELYLGSKLRIVKDEDGKTVAAIPGDPSLLKYIYDRLDGKPDITERIIDEGIPKMIIEAPEGADDEDAE